MENTYPAIVKDLDTHLNSIASRLFGNRFLSDQTLYEYLIEFLLIFVSEKNNINDSGKMSFHNNTKERLEYYIEPRMGLRRFIFFDKARRNGIVQIDETAYKEIVYLLQNKIKYNSEKEEVVDGIKDLLHGYAVVIKNRNWCAQRLLPVCPEMLFCDAMPNKRNRKNYSWKNNQEQVDTTFDFDKRNFLARGGELYYLHILQALEKNERNRDILEKLLRHLLGNGKNKLSEICNFIQNNWENYSGVQKDDLTIKLSISFIPKDAYVECEEYALEELINFLSSELPIINHIELFAKGLMFQILRMLCWRVNNYLGVENKWIVDMKGSSTDNIKKISAKSFRIIEDSFLTALNKIAREIGIEDSEIMKKINDAKKSSLEILRAKGKELQCIIPTKGPNERFSLSVDIIRFLVLALIPPTKKITLNMFLDKIYTHYGIIIGPEEYRKYIDKVNGLDVSLANSFSENLSAFQAFLKASGFLKELSDATSIVFNPYNNLLEA